MRTLLASSVRVAASRRTTSLALAALLLATPLLTACGKSSPVDHVVTSDALATFTPTTTTQTFKDTTTQGTSLGQPRHAKVVRILTLSAKADPLTVLSALAHAATLNSWHVHTSSPTYVSAAKTVQGHHLALSLSLHPFVKPSAKPTPSASPLPMVSAPQSTTTAIDLIITASN